MKTFDYIRAWHDLARPAYDVLPADTRALFLDTAWIAKDLHQDRSCGMIWPTADTIAAIPEASDFRSRFDKIPAEWLAFGAHVINYLGHWKPGKDDTIEDATLPTEAFEACKAGAHWKFSHYADQSLRVRLGLKERGEHTTYPNGGAHLEVHEGVIRVCYASRDMWTWVEVAPATETGKTAAERVLAALYSAIGRHPERNRHERDNSASKFVDECRKENEAGTAATWPESWRPWIAVSARYMVEEGQQGIPSLIYAKATKRMETKITKYPENYEKEIQNFERKKRIELAGRLWWLKLGIDDENLIYYDHTGTFSFGWRAPVSWEMASAILEHASEFPYPYEIKIAKCEMYPHGTKLEGGKG